MIKFKRYRIAYGEYLEVGDDGSTINRIYKSKCVIYPDTHQKLSIRYDNNGDAYVSTKNHGKCKVDYMVASCFVNNPYRREFVIHNDRDKRNCHPSNLKWVTPYLYNTFYGIADWGACKDDLLVSKTGEVMADGNMLSQYDSIFDSDTNLDIPVRPYVRDKNGNRPAVEDLVAAAWLDKPLVVGNLTNPVLIHIDGNYKNNDITNLKWVDPISDEFKAFDKQRQLDRENRFRDLNKHLSPEHLESALQFIR